MLPETMETLDNSHHSPGFFIGTRALRYVADSYLICLPISWVRNNKLNKHSRINIRILEDDKLVIEPDRGVIFDKKQKHKDKFESIGMA